MSKYNRNINSKLSLVNISNKKERTRKMNGYNLEGGGGTKQSIQSVSNKHMSLLSNNIKGEHVNGKYVYKYYNEKDDSTINKNPNRCMCINYKSLNDFNTYDRCQNTIINNTNFCQLHQQCKSYLRQFLSGSENEPDEELWKDPLIEGSHNCYSYFLNRQIKAVKEKCNELCNKNYKNIDECINKNDGCSDLKPQPGDFGIVEREGSIANKKRNYQCSVIENKILQDNPTIFPIAFNNKCPTGYYKGAMAIEPKSTYHFYKQLNNGQFYHKPGLRPISKLDSPFKGENGRPIFIPHFANRDYSTKTQDDEDGINYTSFCSYYCVPQNNIVHKNLA